MSAIGTLPWRCLLRVARWGGFLLSALAAATMIANWCGVRADAGDWVGTHGGRCVHLRNGLIEVELHAQIQACIDPEDLGWRASWWPEFNPWPSGPILSRQWEFDRTGCIFPTWSAFLAAGIPTGLLWWWDRRRPRAGMCVKCGYDLAGLPAGAACPECGTDRTGPDAADNRDAVRAASE